MPVRKIPKNHLVVTGSFASRKNGQMEAFESLLEKELMLLLEFDERVERFEPQPVTIPIPGIPKGYTPDVLIHYHPDPKSSVVQIPRLTEIKHTDDLKRNAEKYAPKFTAAEKFAQERGWEFHVTTQLEIRTQRLANLKFLREYRNIDPAQEDTARLLEAVGANGGFSSPKALLDLFAPTDEERLHWLPVIWHAMVTWRLVADWDQPIDYDTEFHLNGGTQ